MSKVDSRAVRANQPAMLMDQHVYWQAALKNVERSFSEKKVHHFWGRILVTIYGVPHRRFLKFTQIFPHLCFFSVSAILVNFAMRNSPKFR